jgi:hypothetical protein
MVNFLKKYFGAWYVPVLWTCIVATLCCLPGSLLPSETHFKIPQFDKFVHVSMFGGFVFLWNLYEAKRGRELEKLLKLFFLWYVLGNVFGISTEYIQKYWIPGRDYDQADIIADMIGAGLGYGLSNLLFVAGDKPGTGDKISGGDKK